MGRVTIKDVARQAGVSSATVSNVLNDKGKVSENTRRSVRAAVERMNYRPSASAQRRLQQSGQKSIGLVVKEIHNPYFADVIVGAQEAASEHGYSLMVSSSEGSRDTEGHSVDLFIDKDVNGIVINPVLDDNTDLSHLFELKRRNIPFVLLERVHGLHASLVDIDNVEAAKEATLYLVGLGHKKMVHFSGPGYSAHSDERSEGFRQGFFEARLVYSSDFIVTAGASMGDGYATGLAYFSDLAEDERPTAVLCYNDMVAIGLMRALRELGIKVPDDVSLIGFDNVDMCDYAPVPLTTMQVPTRHMGRQAIEVLIRQMEAPDDYQPEHINLHAELMVRASTA